MPPDSRRADFILTMTCPDRIGIVATTTSCLADRGAFIAEAAYFADPDSGRFFGRIVFRLEGAEEIDEVRSAFLSVADGLGMDWELSDTRIPLRVIIMVTTAEYCLNDLLYRYRSGSLKMDIPAIVSNHPVLEPLAKWHSMPFHHLPVTKDTKAEQEENLLRLMEETRSDYLVLARYMQILSSQTCDLLAGRAINIHHSFLPGFKGAQPYRQAHERGVKLIGATAHFVTQDLDEGPIIEQEIQRVDHGYTPDDLAAVGRDAESMVLARAMTYVLERRVLLNGKRTIVFRG